MSNLKADLKTFLQEMKTYGHYRKEDALTLLAHSLTEIERLESSLQAVWDEDHKIRNVLNVNPEESTFDEVGRLLTPQGKPKHTLNIKRLHDGMSLPEYATPGAACFDLRAYLEVGSIQLRPYSSEAIPTGLAFEIPPDWVLLIFSRSGHAFKNGVRLGNCVGVIDSDYRGELRVLLHNDSNESFDVKHLDRIAQGMLVPAPHWTLQAVDTLSDTQRGTGGFGSTGV